MWLDRLANLNHLLEELRLLLVSPRSIDDDNLEPFLLEFRHPLCRYRHGVGLGVGPEVRNLCFRSGLACLVEGAGSEGVCTDDTGLEAALLVMYCKFRACRGFTVTLCRTGVRWSLS